jgi:hypothetical protein
VSESKVKAGSGSGSSGVTPLSGLQATNKNDRSVAKIKTLFIVDNLIKPCNKVGYVN